MCGNTSRDVYQYWHNAEVSWHISELRPEQTISPVNVTILEKNLLGYNRASKRPCILEPCCTKLNEGVCYLAINVYQILL